MPEGCTVNCSSEMPEGLSKFTFLLSLESGEICLFLQIWLHLRKITAAKPQCTTSITVEVCICKTCSDQVNHLPMRSALSDSIFSWADQQFLQRIWLQLITFSSEHLNASLQSLKCHSRRLVIGYKQTQPWNSGLICDSKSAHSEWRKLPAPNDVGTPRACTYKSIIQNSGSATVRKLIGPSEELWPVAAHRTKSWRLHWAIGDWGISWFVRYMLVYALPNLLSLVHQISPKVKHLNCHATQKMASWLDAIHDASSSPFSPFSW